MQDLVKRRNVKRGMFKIVQFTQSTENTINILAESFLLEPISLNTHVLTSVARTATRSVADLLGRPVYDGTHLVFLLIVTLYINSILRTCLLTNPNVSTRVCFVAGRRLPMSGWPYP